MEKVNCYWKHGEALKKVSGRGMGSLFTLYTSLASNILSAVAIVSPQDAWAAGSTVANDGTGHTLIELWDGVQWSIVSSPV